MILYRMWYHQSHFWSTRTTFDWFSLSLINFSVKGEKCVAYTKDAFTYLCYLVPLNRVHCWLCLLPCDVMIIKVMFVFRIICVVCRKDADCWRSSQEQHTLRMMKSSAKSFWWPITTCSSLGPFVKEDALQQKFVQRGLVAFMLLQGKLQHQATYVCTSF